MSLFDDICQATEQLDARKVSLLLLKENSSIDQVKDFALTPAGWFAMRGDWERACWLMTEFEADVGSILYGGIIGGHINRFVPEQEKISEAEKKIWGKYTPSHDEKMMMGFAQLGKEELIKEKVKSVPNSRHLIRSVIRGLAYGKNPVVMEQFFDKEDLQIQLQNAIEGAACSGSQELTIQYMKYFVQAFPDVRQFGYRAPDFALSGAARSDQLELIRHLKSNSAFGHVDIDVAIREAMVRNNDSFVLALVNEFNSSPLIHTHTLISAALLRRVSLVEQFIKDNGSYSFMAIGAIHWAFCAEVLLGYFALFNSTIAVEKLSQELIKNKELDKKVINEIPKIKMDALAIIKLKQHYNLESSQALVLHKHEELLPLILNKDYEADGLCNLMLDKTELNHWQFADMIKKVRKNEAKDELINSLENYLNTKSTWWYNHRERCTSFLDVIKNTRKHKECNNLVARQYRMFHNTEPTNEQVSPQSAKHNQPVKQDAVKDGYYNAIKKYYDTFFRTNYPGKPDDSDVVHQGKKFF